MTIPDYAPEDDPHKPTNLPEDLEDRAHKTFRYTTKRSGSGHTEYVKPQVEEGYPDYALMLDLMDMELGTVFRSGQKLMVVVKRKDTYTRWGDRFEVEDGAIRAVVMDDDGTPLDQEGKTRTYSPGEGHNVLTLFEQYQHGRVEVIGKVQDMG